MKKIFRGPFFWIILGLIGLIVVMDFARNADGFEQITTSQAVQRLEGNEQLTKVTLIEGEQQIRIETPDEQRFKAYWVGPQSGELAGLLQDRVANGTLDEWDTEVPQPSFWSYLLPTLIPFLIIGLLFFWLISSMQGGGSRVMQFGKSKAKIANKDTPKSTFKDVAGCEEALEELEEIKEFLSEPAKFQAVGAKIPKGVLLYGPPGTGKTLLARAVAGEAGVPFYSISGSDFVEMFVGVGASRVRDLFEQAKENAPAIVFVDEIDAVGRHRGAGMGGGNDEREQTLNQLLVEMDGFDVRGGVILIAATNRPDVLDPALLRPGRFDRQIGVEAPDVKGRLQILEVHAQGKPMADDVDLHSVARRTPGFTGADLANVLNEAALLTARANQTMITSVHLEEAVDRVIAGPQKSSRLMNQKELLTTAYHEAGHALVAAAMPLTDPVQKITILPRGRALGYTMVMPDDDKYSNSRGELLDQLAYMLGGRAAEEMVFHNPTTGASNDIDKATSVARAMVTQYGMSERIGAIRLGKGDSEPFVGMEMGGGAQRDYSESVAAVVDEEVRALVSNAHQEAYDVLTANRDVLDELVRRLFEQETLNRAEVDRIFADLRRYPEREPWTGSATRVPSEIPPIQPPVSSTDPAGIGPGPSSGAIDDPHLPGQGSQPGHGGAGHPGPSYPGPGQPGPQPPQPGQPGQPPQGPQPPHPGQGPQPGQPPQGPQPPQQG